MPYNKVIIEGRLVADPELKTTQSGVEFCNFTVAVDRDYKQGEERIADFIPVKAWRGSAKFIGEWFKKGDPILIDGRLEVNKHTDTDGNNKTFTSVVVDRATFTISKKSTADSNSNTAAFTPAAAGFVPVEVEDGELPF